MRFRQFEVVRLVYGFPTDGIEPGTLAVITDVHEALGPGREAGYRLEVHRPGRPLYTAAALETHVAPLLTPPRRELWIMPEYDCYAFWATDGTISGVHDNVSADSLGLSPALVDAVTAWEAVYAATFVDADPARSGFVDAAAEEAFRAEGKVLAERVTQELGTHWDVVYRYGVDGVDDDAF
jgi:hypothetical protein